MRTLCIYALHEMTLNVDFFIENGFVDDPSVDYYFVINNETLKLEVSFATVINRENKNYDFGAWSHVLFMDNIYEKYDYFIFLNSTVRGPFYPVWCQERNWISMFINQLTDDVKLVGTTIGVCNKLPHVQSMLLATDRIGLDIGITNGIFSRDEPAMSLLEIIYGKEINFSTLILENGYNIECMLKAYHGIDFRTSKNFPDSVFKNYGYYGIHVHPYEVIFGKITQKDIHTEENIQLINKYTDWNYAPANEDFRKAELNHCGKFEERSKYYKVHLNPDRTSGLFNQLYSLVNAILLGHYTNRKILLTYFYPEYNTDEEIPIGKIIDLSRLNLIISQLNLSTYVHDVSTFLGHVKSEIDTCSKSCYYNPTKRSGDLLQILAELSKDQGQILDLGDTFSNTLFSNMQSCQQLLIKIPFNNCFDPVVNHIKTKLGLTQYKSIHLRLEDDMLKSLSKWSSITGPIIYQGYLSELKLMIRDHEQIFVATHLTKSPNEMNSSFQHLRQIYPSIVMSSGWRENFPSFYKGRDIDALVDYLICRDAESFLGFSYSTFSRVTMLYLENRGKICYDSANPASFEIIYNKVQHGVLGLYGKLGFVEPDGTDTIDVEGYETISAHAPSVVKIRTYKPCILKGYVSPTSKITPKMTFICDENTLGDLTHSNSSTNEYYLEPGEHTLLVNTENIEWAHSVWILNSYALGIGIMVSAGVEPAASASRILSISTAL